MLAPESLIPSTLRCACRVAVPRRNNDDIVPFCPPVDSEMTPGTNFSAPSMWKMPNFFSSDASNTVTELPTLLRSVRLRLARMVVSSSLASSWDSGSGAACENASPPTVVSSAVAAIFVFII